MGREQRLEELHNRIGNKLAEIAEWFVDPKITIVIRAPHLDDGDVVMTDDDVGLAIAAIQKLNPSDESTAQTNNPGRACLCGANMEAPGSRYRPHECKYMRNGGG